ncbi:hypothetical protein K470DRAFT_258499 [Piedraia hortae CBS 480.64]|uniref:Atrophin-1 multi-domain protein n=1 Tax=Piedraia hortae CBS 480.64 TaxID=1314780 RepID=A0A6A7BXV0_9PEZI|nr:hypothetical protein K470DRAFT_258499 [Piedraia hortae CBS 480.64]
MTSVMIRSLLLLAVSSKSLAAPVEDKLVKRAISYGTFDNPFSASSLWNSVPIKPVLGSYRIPDTSTGWYPTIDDGDYSIGVFKTSASDPSQKILPIDSNGINDPDAEVSLPSVTLPHFPSNALSPNGTDGSVAIHDLTSGRIYSFWQLRQDGSNWKAQQVSWGWQNGTGWGDPALYFQGASASGSPNGAGLIRAAEYARRDDPMYYHALTMTLADNALAGKDGHGVYTWPATSADSWGAQSGQIREGDRLLLPSTFDVTKLRSKELRKVARTLQKYGAYVVDRNDNTPFTIGVQLGLNYEIADKAMDWNNYVASGVPDDLNKVRRALAPMTSCDGYTTGDNKVIKPVVGRDVNLQSMRGPWTLVSGSTAGTFDTFGQRVVFPKGNTVMTGWGISDRVSWGPPKTGEKLRMTAYGSSGASIQLQVSTGSTKLVDTGALTNGKTKDFPWPSGADLNPVWTIKSGSAANGWVSVDLRRV